MKLGLVGNCQTEVIASWLKAMLPKDEIFQHRITEDLAESTAAADRLMECDVIFSQWTGHEHGALSTEHLQDRCSRLILLPNFSFTGFQPDMAYLYSHDGTTMGSPVGAYHSRLIVACYSLDFSPEKTRSLFNNYIFGRLGFFEEFEKAQINFDESAERRGFSFRAKDLCRSGVFMHTINHGNLIVSRAASRDAAIIAGCSPADVPDIEDQMALDTIWPVYPGIAERLNLPAQPLVFKRHSNMAEREIEINLDTMILESFNMYRSFGDIVDFAPFQNDQDVIMSEMRSSY